MQKARATEEMINRALFGCSNPVFPKAKPEGQGGTDVWAIKKATQ